MMNVDNQMMSIDAKVNLHRQLQSESLGTHPPQMNPMNMDYKSMPHKSESAMQSQSTSGVAKKKRKRCGSCAGCYRKDNCLECGPCKSTRSHQICKMRKCEQLKTKKEKQRELVIWGVDSYLYNQLLVNEDEHLKKCNSTYEIHYYWRIKNHAKDAYLFGSIHVPFIKIWRRLPAFLDVQISKSDLVYFELDLLNSEIRRQLLACQLIDEQEHLKNYLTNKQIYRKLKLFFRTKRNEIEDKLYYDLLIRNWQFKKLIWILFLLNFLIENDSQHFRIPSMDNLISLKARHLNKVIRSLETVEDQCAPLNALEPNQVVGYINFTLNNYFDDLKRKQQVGHSSIGNEKNSIDTLIEAYKCGTLDNSLLDSLNRKLDNKKDETDEVYRQKDENIDRKDNKILMQDSEKSAEESSGKSDDEIGDQKEKMKSVNAIFQKQLIEKRNKKISERIAEELRTNKDKSLLFVLGTAHFIASNSVLKHLEDKGYQIEKVNKRFMHSLDPISKNTMIPNSERSNHWRRAHETEESFRSALHYLQNYSNQSIFSMETKLDANSRLDAIRKSYNDFWIYFKLGSIE